MIQEGNAETSEIKKRALVRIKIGGETETLVICESRNCNSGAEIIPIAYSWEHFDDMGWLLRKADMWEGKKASSTNPELVAGDMWNPVPVEAYCPGCAKKYKGEPVNAVE